MPTTRPNLMDGKQYSSSGRQRWPPIVADLGTFGASGDRHVYDPTWPGSRSVPSGGRRPSWSLNDPASSSLTQEMPVLCDPHTFSFLLISRLFVGIRTYVSFGVFEIGIASPRERRYGNDVCRGTKSNIPFFLDVGRFVPTKFV